MLEPSPVPRLTGPMFTTFRGGQSGGWRIASIAPVKGEALALVPALCR